MNNMVNNYIYNLSSPQKEICQRLRKIILQTFPDIKEELKWRVPAYADGKYYIVALKDHVNLGFSIEGLSQDKITLLDGGGKTTRHIQVRSLEEIDQAQIVKLLKLIP